MAAIAVAAITGRSAAGAAMPTSVSSTKSTAANGVL